MLWFMGSQSQTRLSDRTKTRNPSTSKAPAQPPRDAPRDAMVISGAVAVGLGLWLIELFPYQLDGRQRLWKRHGRGQASCFLMKCGFLMET